MAIHPLAGKPAPRNALVNVPNLVSAYYTHKPEPGHPAHRVKFGTSGHRGSSLTYNFNEAHILATSQAIVELRQKRGITGPLYIGMDTHALSQPALYTAVEVLVANGVEVFLQTDLGYTPTPVISHAILTYNRGRTGGLADGVVITPSHNPPEDGGFKYNPPAAGPADTETTKLIENRANELLQNGLKGVHRLNLKTSLQASNTHWYDYVTPYIADLAQVIDMDAITAVRPKIGVDPMGGAGLAFWQPLAERYKLDIEIVNPAIDPTFSFMTLDHDGNIRMDCSSPYAMAGLIELKNQFDIAFGNDPDYDRHGIVTRSSGLMNPNHYLATAIWYLFQHRPGWGKTVAVGKTLVSSSMIDRVTADLGRKLCEVPVGFKWFVDGLLNGSLGFGGEESAGASFLRHDGTVWTTDKDGFILDLLAAEILATTGRDPGEHYQALENQYGKTVYERIDVPAQADQKAVLGNLSPEIITAEELAGERILAKLTHAPCNHAAIGGLKVVTENGWFAARPSGTEDIYKIYAESFHSPTHLKQIQEDAQAMIATAFAR